MRPLEPRGRGYRCRTGVPALNPPPPPALNNPVPPAAVPTLTGPYLAEVRRQDATLVVEARTLHPLQKLEQVLRWALKRKDVCVLVHPIVVFIPLPPPPPPCAWAQ
jgi:hypothetical protein